ncbi:MULTISPECIES: hypothetical protein [Yimella]|uniref:Lipoprotein n=1 Tax=Yimella lutea TaxID=587872 RepID=A0A542EDJ7_9MICO|nr:MULTISPECIES: hypothetical protein [Yimella]MCG8656391.1 hypothetical protein [Yimella sp. NH-Cas1]RYG78399.1 hypothetical protein EU513_01885 [Yimella sp. RIT 621]TQJ13370.1 hypothetical protein FB459_0786 [Yimella lutea]
MSSTAMRNRVAVTSLALVGALGLTACNSDTTVTNSSSTSSSTSSESTSTSESPSSSQTSTSTSESSTTSESPTSSETSSASSESSTTADSGPTDVTPRGTTLKFNQPAVIDESGKVFRLTVKELKVAPESIYSEKNLKKSDGTVYYINFDVSPVKTSGSFYSSSVNGLWLYPSFGSGQKAKRMYGSTDDCKSSYEKIEVGQSGSGCYIYQITGATSKTVTYANSKNRLTWE